MERSNRRTKSVASKLIPTSFIYSSDHSARGKQQANWSWAKTDHDAMLENDRVSTLTCSVRNTAGQFTNTAVAQRTFANTILERQPCQLQERLQ
jgi:hypothetical protein